MLGALSGAVFVDPKAQLSCRRDNYWRGNSRSNPSTPSAAGKRFPVFVFIARSSLENGNSATYPAPLAVPGPPPDALSATAGSPPEELARVVSAARGIAASAGSIESISRDALKDFHLVVEGALLALGEQESR